jgi:hypothetical protein
MCRYKWLGNDGCIIFFGSVSRYTGRVEWELEFDPAPDTFRGLFTGQALKHLDEMVLSWSMGGHPILYDDASAVFQVNLMEGPATLFVLHAPREGFPARVEVDTGLAASAGIPGDLVCRLWEELARIGQATENPHAPLLVSLGRFSRGDRKVFLAYALTIARSIARPPETT